MSYCLLLETDHLFWGTSPPYLTSISLEFPITCRRKVAEAIRVVAPRCVFHLFSLVRCSIIKDNIRTKQDLIVFENRDLFNVALYFNRGFQLGLFIEDCKMSDTVIVIE